MFQRKKFLLSNRLLLKEGSGSNFAHHKRKLRSSEQEASGSQASGRICLVFRLMHAICSSALGEKYLAAPASNGLEPGNNNARNTNAIAMQRLYRKIHGEKASILLPPGMRYKSLFLSVFVLLVLNFFGSACTRKEAVPMRELSQIETERFAPVIMPKVQKCYVAAKQKVLTERPRIELVLRINSKGEAEAYTEHAPSELSKALVDCMNQELKDVELDLPDGSSGGTLSVELSPE